MRCPDHLWAGSLREVCNKIVKLSNFLSFAEFSLVFLHFSLKVSQVAILFEGSLCAELGFAAFSMDDPRKVAPI